MSRGSPIESAYMPMRFEFQVPSGPTAFLFPGQGAHHPGMLEPFRHAPGFAAYYDRVCSLLGRDPLSEARANPALVNRNADSSLLTVLASVVCLALVRTTAPGCRAVATAGYSVGQWTALYAAGALSVDDLFLIVYRRARLMDACVAATEPSGMLAVIGIEASILMEICEEARRLGGLLEITNENAPRQFTLGGTEKSLQWAEARLAAMRPKRLRRVPVAAAWHSTLLRAAVPSLAEFLNGRANGRPEIPVIDNTTGGWLPEDDAARRTALARQVASPVLWRQGIETLAAFGVRNLIEIGSGDVLTKYGFFIDRSLCHLAVAPPPRIRS
jgi:[acyl-carrier-protein] S-malonyltransferase